MTQPRTNANTVDALIGAAAARCPDRVAIADTRDVTYGEMAAASAHLAAQLVSRGVKPDSVVGLCLPRGADQLVALLAILRSGAAVLPLDPTYPRDLLAYMLADSVATLVLTDSETNASLPEGPARFFAANVCDVLPEQPGPSLPPSGAEDSLCYLLYTSGSTGRPKGVAMPHRAMLNLTEWHRSAIPLDGEARVLQFAPLSFDVSFQEIFSTWADGGTLVIVDEATRRDPQALWRMVAEKNVQRLFLPYVALQVLAERAPERLPMGLREVITAGGQLRITPQIRAIFSRLQGVRLHNHYGPTETHVCTAHTLNSHAAEWPLLPPIGKPIAQTEALVLDEERQPATEGELYVGGACLAQGYFRRADLTAERFLTIGDSRYYRTGDLVRRRADGELEYLGRADDQLKVRGFRVEPAEIEAHLSQHPAIRECAVTARDQRLLAYWVGDDVDGQVLREFLGTRLPAHFIPSFYTRLETMPLTASGKINRRSLPDPAYPIDAGHPKPSSRLETTIARIWADVLGIPSVPRDVNFGDLGGTSLHAAEAQAKLGDELHRELSVTQLHENPTVAALANSLEGNRTDTSLRESTKSRAASQRVALNRRTRQHAAQ
jgi:amino acid adenylation domain-containing protein